jgi:hypothetical protein
MSRPRISERASHPADVAPLKPATNLGLPERVIAKPVTNQGEVRRSGGLSRPGPGPTDSKRSVLFPARLAPQCAWVLTQRLTYPACRAVCRGLTTSQYGQLKAAQHNLGVKAAGVTKPNAVWTTTTRRFVCDELAVYVLQDCLNVFFRAAFKGQPEPGGVGCGVC